MKAIKDVTSWLKKRLTKSEYTLLRGGTAGFVVKVIGATLSFGSHIVLARILGTESFGRYVYALNWAKVAILFGTLGFTTASVKFVSEYVSSRKWPLLKDYLQYSRRLTFIISISVSSLFGVGAYLSYIAQSAHQAWTFAVAAITVPLAVRMKVGSAELRGLKQIVRARLPQSVVLPSLLITIIYVFCVIIGLESSGPLGMVGYLIAVGGAVGFIDWFRRKSMPAQVVGAEKYSMRGRRKHWVRTSLDMVLIAGFNMVLFRADTIMVGAFVSPEASGIYSVASKVAFLQTFGLVAVTSILAPVVSDLYAKGDHQALQNSVRRGAQGSFTFAFLMTIGILAFQDPILEAFGTGFLEGRRALWALLFGQLVNSFVGPALVLLNMTGHQRKSAWILGGSAMLNIVLNALLVPIHGVEGAGVATAVTIMIWNIAIVFECRRSLGIHPTPIW